MKILVIDDSPADRELAIRALEREFAGAQFVEVGRKQEFALALEHADFDVVLSDFRLHWTDGLHVLKEVKARYPYVPVIFLTESGSEEIAVESMKAGLSDYVLKHHLQHLPVTVREALAKTQLRLAYDRAAAELRQAHADLQQAAEGLERRVEERTAELARRETSLRETGQALALANETLRRQDQDLRQEIAERRRIEEEREWLLTVNLQQREILEQLIAAAPVGIAMVRGRAHAYEFANPAYQAALDITVAEPIAGQNFASVTPDLAGLERDLLAPAAVTGQTVSMREFLLRPGGDAPVYLDLDAVPLHTTLDGVVDLLVLVNDVTQQVLARLQAEDLAIQLAADIVERRAVEEQLREARDRLDERVQERTAELEAIFDSLPDAVYVGDAHSIQRCNRVALHNLGCENIEELRKNFATVNARLENRYADTGERIPSEDEAFARALRGEPHTYEVISRNLTTGEDVVQRCAARPIWHEGRILGAVVVNTDITERKRTEQALRTQQQRLLILHEIDAAILAAKSPADIAGAVVERIRQIIPCERATVLIYDWERDVARRLAESGDGQESGEVLPMVDLNLPEEHERRAPHYIPDLLTHKQPAAILGSLIARGIRSHVSLPLAVENQIIGSLNLASLQPNAFAPDAIEAASQAAMQLAIAMQSARLHEQVRVGREQMQQLSRRLLESQENQARAIARELHDESGQALTALMLGLGALERDAACPPAMAARLADLKDITDAVLEGLHRLSANLRPITLDRLGLSAALRQHVETFREQTGLTAKFEQLGMHDKRLPSDVETAIYRIVQEALTNVARHAQATTVGVLLEHRGDTILALIEDNGRGFDVDDALSSGRLGMTGMRERAEMLGGTLAVESTPGNGTCVIAQIPCKEAPSET